MTLLKSFTLILTLNKAMLFCQYLYHTLYYSFKIRIFLQTSFLKFFLQNHYEFLLMQFSVQYNLMFFVSWEFNIQNYLVELNELLCIRFYCWKIINHTNYIIYIHNHSNETHLFLCVLSLGSNRGTRRKRRTWGRGIQGNFLSLTACFQI